jgi:divalent metal cation (Fe/Co/Zn/Cd) transporter
MDPTKDSIIDEARQLIGEYEKQTKQLFFAYLVMTVVSVVMIGVFAYGVIKADEIKKRSVANSDASHQSDAFVAVNRMIDLKIDLLRAEMHLRQSPIGIIGGALLGLAVGGLLTRKKRIRQARVLRGMVNLVNKDS